MTAYATDNPFFNLTDAVGNPVTGGRVYIGIAGLDPETNPQQVYWDSAQTQPASQPLAIKGGYIVNGSTPAVPYTAGSYSIRAYDALGNVIYYLASITGLGSAALVNFTPSGTGATIRTVEAKLRDTVNVKDFGCVVDGSTDDTTAFQNALNSGRDLILAPGTMVIGPVTASTQGQQVIGSLECIIKHKAGTGADLITITGAQQVWRGFAIDGNSANVSYVYNKREVLVKAADVTVEGLRITNAQSQPIGATLGAPRVTIRNNYINGCGDFGIFVNNAEGSGADPSAANVTGNTVIEFGSQGGGGGATTSVGIGVRSLTGGQRIEDNFVQQTSVRTNDQLGIECWSNSDNAVISGNTIDGSAAGAMEFGISATGNGSIVSSNLVLGTSKYAIEIIDRAVSCTGNVLRSPAGAGISVNLNASITDSGDIMVITGNTIENTSSLNGSYAAINVQGAGGLTPIAITISGNTIHGLSHGIVVSSTVTGYTISGNTIYNTGSVQSSIIALGTDGTVVGNTAYRVSAAGGGNGGNFVIDGSGHLVGLNRISGNGRMDNGILINSTATNALITMNMITGCTNSVFSSSTDSSIVVQGGMGSVGITLNAANYAEGWFNTGNKSVQAQKTPVAVGNYTAATLPTTGIISGTIAYCTDANATTQNAIVAGGGANKVIVAYDGAAWRIG